MGLRLYNTLTKKLEDFVPKKDVVGIYTCGLTVQGPPHVGHIRAAIVRDVLTRWLLHAGYTVTTVENFTDVDDKIIEKQKETHTDWRIIAEGNIEKYLTACNALNIIKASIYPRASQHIEEIMSLVQRLIDRGFAYEKEGDVYFSVRKFPDYGRLSNKSLDELMTGVRVEPSALKEDPLDFAVWKAAKPGEPYWLSPWGKGRPGWHIECSAMSMHYLGESFDIHTGGEDLIFPHHENEIAQSVAATDKEFARYWLHNGWVLLRGEKMSKSTGHYFLIEEVLKDYRPNIIRLYLLKTHYRSQVEFSKERLDEAMSAYARIADYLKEKEFRELPKSTTPLMLDEFTEAMNDDLNTSKALSIIFDLVTRGNEKLGTEEYENECREISASIKYFLAILGFSQEIEYRPELMDVLHDVRKKLKDEGKGKLLDDIAGDFLKDFMSIKDESEFFPMMINLLLRIRDRLRQEKNYELADYIRQRLLQERILVYDGKTGASTYRTEAP
jgi:cysteinyl-tRNA synthetase